MLGFLKPSPETAPHQPTMPKVVPALRRSKRRAIGRDESLSKPKSDVTMHDVSDRPQPKQPMSLLEELNAVDTHSKLANYEAELLRRLPPSHTQGTKRLNRVVDSSSDSSSDSKYSPDSRRVHFEPPRRGLGERARKWERDGVVVHAMTNLSRVYEYLGERARKFINTTWEPDHHWKKEHKLTHHLFLLRETVPTSELMSEEFAVVGVEALALMNDWSRDEQALTQWQVILHEEMEGQYGGVESGVDVKDRERRVLHTWFVVPLLSRHHVHRHLP